MYDMYLYVFSEILLAHLAPLLPQDADAAIGVLDLAIRLLADVGELRLHLLQLHLQLLRELPLLLQVLERSELESIELLYNILSLLLCVINDVYYSYHILYIVFTYQF